MSELVTVTLKMTIELRDRLKARATAEGTSVSALLIDGVTSEARPDPQAAEALAAMTKDRDQWRDRAKAIVSAGRVEVNAVSAKAIGHHAAGPILEPKLKVQGQARPFFRPGTNADKATKAG